MTVLDRTRLTGLVTQTLNLRSAFFSLYIISYFHPIGKSFFTLLIFFSQSQKPYFYIKVFLSDTYCHSVNYALLTQTDRLPHKIRNKPQMLRKMCYNHYIIMKGAPLCQIISLNHFTLKESPWANPPQYTASTVRQRRSEGYSFSM